MIKAKNPEVKAQTKHRLSRIEGQLRGVQKMIDEDRDCKDIVQQLVAIRASIQSASLNFMQEVANECMLEQGAENDPEKQRKRITDLIQLLGKVSN